MPKYSQKSKKRPYRWPGKCCCVPGCMASATNKDHVFTIPTLSGRRFGVSTVKWAKEFHEVLLRYRDDFMFRKRLAQGAAFICKSHFNEEDIQVTNCKSFMKIGVIPSKMPNVEDLQDLPYILKYGLQCAAYGCCKRERKIVFSENVRSDSDGSEDEESAEKQKFSRTFYPFPSDPTLLKKWIINMRRKDWKPSKTKSLICSDHFKEEDIDRSDRFAQLKPGAIPTRFKAFRKQGGKFKPTGVVTIDPGILG